MQKIIVRHKTTNFLYSTLDGRRFRNIISGEEREVPDELIERHFSINLDATEILNGENGGNIERLIGALNLKIEVKNEINKQGEL